MAETDNTNPPSRFVWVEGLASIGRGVCCWSGLGMVMDGPAMVLDGRSTVLNLICISL